VAGADPVVFNVNMSIQTMLGKFNAGNGDKVMLSGNFNAWATTNVMTMTANPDVYSITQSLSTGYWPNYKFIITNAGVGGVTWEVPASFGGGDRYFQVPTNGLGTNLPVVYFSDQTNPPGLFHITFQVNMGVPITQGAFDTNSSLAYAFGSWSNWLSGYGLLLTNVPGTSNYMRTLDMSNTLNTVVYYKYNINAGGGTWEGNVGPSNTVNRVFTLTNFNMVLPLEYWNNITNAYTNYVTFQVDTLVEHTLGIIDANADWIYVNGDWDWSGTAMRLYQTDNPYVFTNTVALHNAPGSVVNYKYTVNGTILWENDGVGPGGAQNHQFELLTTNLPLDHFNNYTDLGPVDISLSGNQAGLTWASGSNANNHIRLQNSTNLQSGWTDVPNTQGIGAVTNNFGDGSQFFRLIGP